MTIRQIESTEHQQKIKCSFAILKQTETSRESWYRNRGYWQRILVKDTGTGVEHTSKGY